MANTSLYFIAVFVLTTKHLTRNNDGATRQERSPKFGNSYIAPVVSTNNTTMKNILITITLTLFSFCLSAQEQNDKSYAKQQLELALKDTIQPNAINDQVIIDSSIVIKVIEPILFKIYGKEHIIEQRPYDISFIDKYWIINGTMKEVHPGGTFLIIVDSRNGQIIKLIHGE
jgi:hypothetical protein